MLILFRMTFVHIWTIHVSAAVLSLSESQTCVFHELCSYKYQVRFSGSFFGFSGQGCMCFGVLGRRLLPNTENTLNPVSSYYKA